MKKFVFKRDWATLLLFSFVVALHFVSPQPYDFALMGCAGYLVMAAAASTTTTLQLNMLPQFFFFVASTVPTAFKVTPLGQSPNIDLDGAGLGCLKNIRSPGALANSYLVCSASGVIKGLVSELTFTNALASVVNVYGLGEEPGEYVAENIRNTVLAGNPVDIVDFGFIGFPNAGATDVFNITYKNGLTHKYVRDELPGLIGMTQNDTSGYNIDNMDQTIKCVQVVPTATQVIYVLRFKKRT